MDRVRWIIGRVARASLPVLIQGETGTGKELVAGALHAQSGRRGRLVAFNVGAIPESVFESAVFGHVRGAFTGAVHDAEGFLTEADRGTAFFDEIGTLSAAMQAKLLRALETGIYRPVGARRDRRSDFRIVAACNEVLREQVHAGLFRADLAHRLSGYVIALPPLRERPGDIELLARHFAVAADVPSMHFTPEALRLLQSHEWPGNVRELRMFIDRLIAVADPRMVHAGDVEEFLLRPWRAPARICEPVPTYVSAHAAGGAPPAPVDVVRVLDVLAATRGDTAEAARRLGVHRSTLYRWMKQHDIQIRRREGACEIVHSHLRTDSQAMRANIDNANMTENGKSVPQHHLENEVPWND